MSRPMVAWIGFGSVSVAILYIVSCIMNPFMPNGTSVSYQLDQSISILRVVVGYFSFLLRF